MASRKYDIIIYGCTGFTGKLVAQYFADHVDITKIKWGIAGRNINKLEALKAKFILANKANYDIGVFECDATNMQSLLDVSGSTKILISTVGPYALYGENTVAACVATNTHYCDITGEPAFVQNIIKKFGAEAREKGLYIINCCGFDSIPADAGAFFTAMQLPANEQKTINGFVSTNASFSGGTYASAINAFSEMGKSISLFGTKKQETKSDTKKQTAKVTTLPYFEKQINKWALPMPVIDPWIVQRSAKLRPSVYGSDFHYAQFMAIRKLQQVISLVGSVGAVIIGAQIPPIKNMLLNLKKSGEGPSQEQRDKSTFQVVFIGKSETMQIKTKVSGGDPGYTETSKMLSETALTLLANLDKMDTPTGITTPVGALGSKLIDKLISKGIRFEVIDE